MRGVRRFVEDLLRQRRPRPFRAGQHDEPELRAAIMLRAATAGDTGPSEEFVAGLHERLANEMASADQPQQEGAQRSGAQRDGQRRIGQPGSRRRFVRTASVAAAAAAIGVGAGDVLARSGAGLADSQQQGEPTLRPDVGQWRVVAASGELPEGGVRAFDLGSVTGFVQRSGGRLRAVSGVCTHLGCRLSLDAPARQLRCPCHTASFALSGEVLHHELPISLQPLPLLPARENNGTIEVFAPPSSPA